MKLSLLILTLAVSMAVGYTYHERAEEEEENYSAEDGLNALIESLFAKQQAIGMPHTPYSMQLGQLLIAKHFPTKFYILFSIYTVLFLGFLLEKCMSVIIYLQRDVPA